MRGILLSAEEIYVPLQAWTREELQVLGVKARLLGFTCLFFDKEWSWPAGGEGYTTRVTWHLHLDCAQVEMVQHGQWSVTTSDIPF